MAKTPLVTVAKNGKYWQANWTDPDGERHRKSLGPMKDMSKRGALEAAQEWAIQMSRQPELIYDDVPLLGDWIDYFMRSRGEEMKPGTIAIYEQTTKRMIKHFGRDIRIDKIKPMHADRWKRTLPTNPATRAKHARNAKAIFSWAIEMEYLSRNPFRLLKGQPPRKVEQWHYVSIEAADKILAACPTDEWRNYFSLMRFAGLRRGEAMRMKWADVDTDRKMLHVRPDGYEGTKQRYRVVPMSPKLAQELIANGAERPVASLSESNHDKVFKSVLDSAGLKPWPKLFHTLRQNAGRDWWDHHPAPDVARWMGHSLDVAMRNYGSESTLQMKKATGEL